ncbi:MAG: TonB-dependent receptor plug domain-containing protein [Anaerohalosphaeraceae bacterium]|nr:TonB-dependent receptor plug domain-containing protein [Anaerohalosphaeraceae bacterium]
MPTCKEFIWRFVFVLTIFSVFGICTEVFAEQQKSNEAAEQEPNEQDDFLEMSLEELMDVPVVVSASRQEQKITEISVPISVVTAKDIHYSGMTNIPEILQFVPGVDVLKIDRYSYAVGVRGLHGVVTDRTLSLVNGRQADSPSFGGPEFLKLPILLEDIERIEVTRGPGGAAWGANAFTGVINIITKKPEDVLGYFGSTTINEFGDSYTHLRWAEKQGEWCWRVSVGYEDVKSSDDAGTGSYQSFSPALTGAIGFNNYSARDFSRNVRFDSEAVRHITEMTDFSFGFGYTQAESGTYEQVGYFPRGNMQSKQYRGFAKLEHKFENGSSGYIQWFGNFSDIYWPNIGISTTSENDIEAQYNFSLAENHEVSVGGNFRWIYIDPSRNNVQQALFVGEPFNEYWAGLFLIDRWQATDRLTIESQIRGDRYSETRIDWSGRLTALYALDAKKNHIFRVSTARAFRAPLVAQRKYTATQIPVGGGLYAINAHLPDDKLHNEETCSIEAGYTGILAKGVTLRADTYYQRFSNLIGYRLTTDIFGLAHYVPDNIDGADSWGGELELKFENEKGMFSFWYAYNDFAADMETQSLRANLPAEHKAGLTGRLFLAKGLTFNANYKFTDSTVRDPSQGGSAGSSNRLDLTIAKAFADGKGELMFGVSDLLNKTTEAIHDFSRVTGHETPGRMFFTRVQYKF